MYAVHLVVYELPEGETILKDNATQLPGGWKLAAGVDMEIAPDELLTLEMQTLFQRYFFPALSRIRAIIEDRAKLQEEAKKG